MDFRPHKAQLRVHNNLRGVGTIVPAPAEPLNAAKQLRLAMERGIKVVIKSKRPGSRHVVQTAPVEIDEVETPDYTASPKVFYYSGIKDRKRVIDLDTIVAIHPAVLDETAPEDS